MLPENSISSPGPISHFSLETTFSETKFCCLDTAAANAGGQKIPHAVPLSGGAHVKASGVGGNLGTKAGDQRAAVLHENAINSDLPSESTLLLLLFPLEEARITLAGGGGRNSLKASRTKAGESQKPCDLVDGSNTEISFPKRVNRFLDSIRIDFIANLDGFLHFQVRTTHLSSMPLGRAIVNSCDVSMVELLRPVGKTARLAACSMVRLRFVARPPVERS